MNFINALMQFSMNQGAAALTAILCSLAIVQAPSSAFARNVVAPKPGMENETPKELEEVGIDEKLGDRVNLDLQFKNEKGELVSLRSYASNGKPILLSLAYFGCPSLCNFHLNGMNDALKEMKRPVGEEFNYVIVSIEPKETPQLAAEKKANYLTAYGRPEGEAGWNFLVGEQESITALAGQVGFNYRWDEEQQQWAHAAAAIVITPDGRISRYLYGIVFDPKTVRLSMIEAAGGQIGTIVDKLILFCFHFDPKESKYTLYAFNVMRAGGLLTVAVLAAFLLPFWFRNRRQEKEAAARSRMNNRVQGEA